MVKKKRSRQQRKTNKACSEKKRIFADLENGFSRILLFLFILLLPTQLGKHFFFPFSYLSGVRVDYLAPTLYLTDIIAVVLTFLSLKNIVLFFKNKFVALIFLLLVIDIPFSLSVPLAVYSFVKILELFCVGVVVFYSELNDRLVLFGLTIAAAYESFLAVLQLVIKQSMQGVFYFLGERYMDLSTPGIAKASINGIEFLRPYATFSHPNSLAGFFLLVYAYVLVNKRFNSMIFLKYFALFFSTLLVLVSFSKVAITAYLIITFFFVLTRFKQCRICSIARLLAITVVGVLFMQSRGDTLTIFKRIDLIKNSLAIIAQHPLFGVGIGNYLTAQNTFPSKFLFFFNQPVHNIFLLFIGQTGVLTGGAILVSIFFLLKKRLNVTLLTVLAAIFLTGMFDHYWLTLQQNMLLMGSMVGLSIRGDA